MSNVAVHTVDGQDTLHAVLRRGRHVLLVAGETQPDLAPYRDQVEVVSAPLGRPHGCVLVRPDGYVAAVGTGTDTTAVLDYVQELAPTVGTAEYAGV